MFTNIIGIPAAFLTLLQKRIPSGIKVSIRYEWFPLSSIFALWKKRILPGLG